MFRLPLICCATFLLSIGAMRAEGEKSGFQGPKILTRAPVPYPEVAHLNRIEGVVRIKFIIDDTGHVTDAAVVGTSRSVMLDDVVRERGIRQWVFQPATLNGKPVPSTFEQEFEFRLDPAEERAIALKRLARPIGVPEVPYPPEALEKRLEGKAVIGVHWTEGEHAGLVSNIYLVKSSGSGLLDRFALRFAYENWRIDPTMVTKQAFTKTVEFKAPQ